MNSTKCTNVHLCLFHSKRIQYSTVSYRKPHCIHTQQLNSSVPQTFFYFILNFCWTHVHFWGHLFPCLGLLVTSALGSALFQLCRGIHDTCSLIHLWYDTSAGVYGQHSSWLLSPYACFSRGRMPDLNHRPPAWQLDVLTTQPQRPDPVYHVEKPCQLYGHVTLIFTGKVMRFK